MDKRDLTQLRLVTLALVGIGGIGLLLGDIGVSLLGASFGAFGMFLIIRERKEGER